MPNINCTEFRRLLAQAVESHQPADSDQLREHTAHCLECREIWLDAVLVDSAVAIWKSAVPPVQIADQVLFQIAEWNVSIATPAATSGGSSSSRTATSVASAATFSTSSNRRRNSRRALAALLTACAALYIAVFLSRADRSSPSGENAAGSLAKSDLASAQPVIRKPTKRDPATTTAPKPSQLTASPIADRRVSKSTPANPPVNSLVRNASSAYLNLASEAAEAVTAVTVLVPPPDASDAPKTPSPNASANEGRWVDDVQRELAPVTSQLGQAFEFLIQAVPAEKNPAT